MMITLTLYDLIPINILAMVYIMYLILFQYITMIDSEKIYDFYDFWKNCHLHFFNLKT